MCKFLNTVPYFDNELNTSFAKNMFLTSCRRLLHSSAVAGSKRFFKSERFTQRQVFLTRKSGVRRLPLVRLSLVAGAVTFVSYDGFVNKFVYSGSSIRFVRSLKTATLICIDYLLLNQNDPDYETKLKAVHQKSADRLLYTCLVNGGLYIKVGQGFAAINHILPREYTTTLSKLQDECLPSTSDDVRKVFITDFGYSPEDIFAEFNYTPVAAASLAQVFRAKLKSGEKVAVKVQYIDLQRRFISDLSTIMFLHDIVEFFFSGYNFGWILKDLRKNLVYEMDFVHEGKNAERCSADLKKFAYVRVPKVYWDYTKERILTLEWMDGFKISDICQIKKHNLSIRELDVKLFKIFAEQIFNTGFVHADPHPGNIFVLPKKNGSKGEADIILLDHGLYEEVPVEVRKPLCEFWVATVLRDERKMALAAHKLGIKDHMKFAEVLFQQPIRIHGGRVASKLTEKDIEYMQKIAAQNFELIMSTLREMPRNMLFVVRNLNTVRAIGHHHGDVVDRPGIMARYAQRCIFKESNYTSSMQYMKWLCHRAYFEYCLWTHSFRLRCINWYFNILYLIGRAPESAKTIMKEMMEQPS